MNCGICKNDREHMLFCAECNEKLCIKCYEIEQCEHLENIYFICEDCDSQQKAHVLCSECGQNLCHSCDFRLHNKAKRA